MSAVKKPRKPQTRLSPEVRKGLILDHAAQLIAAEGVSAVKMERLGRQAGVSKALIYSYFPSVTALLQTLLRREYRRLRRRQSEAADSAVTFEQLVRRVTHVYLAYIRERGLIIERLAAEPSVAEYPDPTAYSRETAVTYLAEIVAENLELDLELARPLVDISFGLPAAAGNYLIHSAADIETVEDLTVAMILGSLEAVARKNRMSFKRLRRPAAQQQGDP